MVAVNSVILAGNVTRDPEIRRTKSGESVMDLGMAINEQYKGKDGQAVQSVCFVDVAVWGRQAESCAQYLTKGVPVMVEGKLQFDQWKTEEGEKRSKLRVRAQRVMFLGGPSQSTDEAADEEKKAPVRPDRAAPARSSAR